MDSSQPGSSVHGFSRQDYWSELPFPSPGNLPDPGIIPMAPALQADSLPLSHHVFFLYVLTTSVFFLKSIYIFGLTEWVLVAACRIFNFCWRMWNLLVVACRIQFPDQGLNPGTLHWKHRVLATGLPGKSPLLYSCLEKSIDREAWWARVHGVEKSWRWLSS